MAKFRFTGPEPRDFHDFGHLEPGAQVDAKDNPDPVWFEQAPTKSAKSESE